MKKNVIIVLLIAFTAFQCNCKKQGVRVSETKNLIITNSGISEAEKPSYTIKSVAIDGKILNVNLETLGQKGKNEFELLWSGAVMKSLPPKAVFVISHKPIDVSGKQKIEHNLRFNLQPMLDKLANYNEIIIMISGFEESLKYTKK